MLWSLANYFFGSRDYLEDSLSRNTFNALDTCRALVGPVSDKGVASSSVHFFSLYIWCILLILSISSLLIFERESPSPLIPLVCLPRENERCYSGRTTDVGMYDAMFAAGLRLPLAALHHYLVNFMGLSVSQITLNAWRNFIGAKIL